MNALSRYKFQLNEISRGSFGFVMPRLAKKIDQDRAFDEDFSFDFGFVLDMMESASEKLEFTAADMTRRADDLGVDRFIRRVRQLEGLRASRGGSIDAEMRARAAALSGECLAIEAGFASIDRRTAELEQLIDRYFRHAEMALIEMVDIVRRRIEVLMNRPNDGESLGEAAAALVLMERILTGWRGSYARNGSAVNAALEFATESIDNFDCAAAEAFARDGIPFVGLRDMLDLDGGGEPGAPHAA